MDRYEMANELTRLISGYLKDEAVELVELIYRYEGRDPALRILVDKVGGGISLDECTRHNRAITSMLEESGLLQQPYLLEVSSPGLDRPLKTKGDFLRCLGRKARFFLGAPVDGRIEWEGVIKSADEESVVIEAAGKTVQMPYAVINKAKQFINGM